VRGLLLHRAGCTYRGGQEGLFAAPDPQSCPGCYFERIILPDLRARFAFVGWWLLDAADYGVPQHRRRVILWAGPAPLTEPTPTHGPGRALPWVSMGEALGLGGGEVHSQRSPETAKGGNRWIPVDEPSATIGCASQPQWRPFTTRTTEGWDREEVAITGPSPAVTCQLAKQARPWLSAGLPWLAQPSPTVSAIGEQKGSGPGVLYTQSRPNGEIEPCADKHAPTVLTGWGDASVYRTFGSVCVATPEGRRRLTVAECALLQDFPSDHPWQGGAGARYRQVGNAVPPRLAEVVGAK
jgi:site-specific DNA-cytosine methylase